MMMNATNTPPRLRSGAALLVAALAVAALGGCRGDRSDAPPRQFFPDLDDQPKWRPQTKSGFYADGRAMRVPVEGTVAFGRQQFVTDDDWAGPFMQGRDDLLKADGLFYEGRGEDQQYAERIPFPVDVDMVKLGEKKFNIYCAACHGYSGDGKGMVGQQWSYPLPNFHDAKYKDPSQPQGRDGYLFHIARYGVVGPDGAQKMPPYAHAIDEREAWAVVSYIRALQATREGTVDDVPEAQRPAIERGFAAKAAAAPIDASPAAPAGPAGDAPSPSTRPPAGGAPQ